MGTRSPSESVDEQRAEDSGSGESETDSSADPISEDSGSAAFAQRVHPAEQFRAERGEAEDVDSWTRSDRGNARRERPRGSKRPKHLRTLPPKSMLKGSIFFFVFQHVPATPISAGSYGRLFLPPLILPLTGPRHLILFLSEMTLLSHF